MKRSCYIVYAITIDKFTKGIKAFHFYNCFETEEQAKASLQYEVDVTREACDEECEWLNEHTIRYPEGCNPYEETIVTYEHSVPFHDRDEKPIKY